MHRDVWRAAVHGEAELDVTERLALSRLLLFPGGSVGKVFVCNSGDLDWIPESGRSPGEGNGNPFQYSCLENLMSSTKRQKDMTLEDRAPRSEGVQYITGEERRAVTNSSRKNEVVGPKWKWHSALDVSGGESKVPCYKEQFCTGTCNVTSMNQSERMWSISWQDWTLTS